MIGNSDYNVPDTRHKNKSFERGPEFLCWCSDQPTSKQNRQEIGQSTAQKSRILWSFEWCTRPSLARNIQPTKRKTKNIEQTKPINQPTNPKDNNILPFERCPRPSYWAPPVPQTPRSPLCLRSSYLPLPVKGLFTHFTHLKRIFKVTR